MYGIQSVSELETVLGLFCCYSSSIYLQEEVPYIFRCIFLAESDSGVTRSKKTSYVGEALEKNWFLTSVG